MWIKKKTERPQSQPPKSASDICERAIKTNEEASPGVQTADREASRLGLSLQVKGEISGNEVLYIHGTAEGLVRLGDGKLTIATTANVRADISAGEVVVYGKVKGNVRATGRIEIKKEGSVEGDLTTPQILIEDGAYFRGSIEIEKSVEKKPDKDVLPPAA